VGQVLDGQYVRGADDPAADVGDQHPPHGLAQDPLECVPLGLSGGLDALLVVEHGQQSYDRVEIARPR
jgi:hypothetical protein